MAQLSIVGSSLLFALAGLLVRSRLRTTLTRIQLIAFWLIAYGTEEMLLHLMISRQFGLGLLADARSATVAIVLTKWNIEGLPRWLASRLR